MAGTLSATVVLPTVVTPTAAAFSASGSLDTAALSQIMAFPAAFSSSGTLAGASVNAAPVTANLTSSGAMTAVVTQKYTPAPAFSSVGALTATVVKGTAHYYDDFNRADTTTLGANWTQRNTTSGNQFQIAGNRAAAPTTSTIFSSSVWAQTMPTDNTKVSFTVKGLLGSGYVGVIVRGSSTEQIMAVVSASSTGISIYTNSGGAAENVLFTGANRYLADTGAAPVDGDIFSIEAQGNRYILSKNGAPVGAWVDSTNLYPYVDSSHREVGIVATCNGSAALTAGIDTWQADEIEPRTFADFSGTGTLSATVTKWFEQSTEINTNRSGVTVPAHATGVWVTIIGGGGGAGSGRRGTVGSGCGGGAGGGGGGFVPRVFIPVASLGATYSVTVATSGAAGGASQTSASTNGNNGTAGTATTFVSGVTSISVGGGGPGTGGTTSTSTAGAGGTVSGATGTGGTAGGGGAAAAAGAVGTNSGASNSSAAGGGGGGGISSGGTKFGGGTGGSANGQTGGAGGNNSTAPAGGGGSGINAGVAASGAGGGGGGSSAPGSGGPVTGYGGGGGGGAGYTANTGAGGTGGPGYSKLEWV